MAWLIDDSAEKYPSPTNLILLKIQWVQMRDHVESELPDEACGLVAGYTHPTSFQAQEIIPVSNSLHSPYRYRMEPQEQLDAFLIMEEQGLELVAIYHSHPEGPLEPSATDIKEAYYPETVHLIWYLNTGNWICRGYLIQKGQVRELEIKIDE